MARRILLLAGVALLAGCASAAPAPDAPAPTTPPAPRPPASCLLDVASLAATTGIGWTAGTATATETRCVYDPDGPVGPAFITVELGPAAELDTIAQACDQGTRQAAPSGFVCRLGAGSLLAASTGDSRTVTVSVSEVPAGTTAEALTRALAEQLSALR